MPGGEDDVLEALLARWLEADETGTTPSVEELCGVRSDLVPVLRELIGMTRSIDGPTADPLLGRKLGDRYKLTERLGAGGMGLVYGARDERLDRRVAVKVLEDLFRGDPERVARFRREAHSLAALQHPNIVAVHDVELEGTPPFLVMDRIEGCDLATLLRELGAEIAPRTWPEPDDVARVAERLLGAAAGAAWRRPWPETVARLGVEMAAALSAAHEHGVLHRDVKPSNFLLDARARLHLCDFGLARRELDPALTRSETPLGTPLYRAPEQVRGEEATAKSDLHALGATLYECLTLRPPYAGRGRELETRILCDEPVPPRRLVPRVPRDLEAIVLTALRKAPAQRYADAAAVRLDLERFLAFEPVVARPGLWPRPVRAAVSAWRRWRPPLYLALPGAAIAAIVIALATRSFGTRLAEDIDRRRTAISELVGRVPPICGLFGTASERARVVSRDLGILERLLDLDPDNLEARFLQVMLLREQPRKDVGERLATAERALGETWGADADVLRRCENAFVLVRDRESHPRGRAAAFADALQALGDPPETAPLRLLHGRLACIVKLDLGRVVDARREAEALESDVLKRQTALTLFVRGNCLAASGRHGEALNLLEQAAALAPGDAATLHGVAMALNKLRRYDEALENIEAALEISRDHFNFHEVRLVALRGLRDFAAAERALQEIPERFRFERILARGNLRYDQALAGDPAERERLLGEAEASYQEIVRAESAAEPRLSRLARTNLSVVAAARSLDWKRILPRALSQPLDWPVLADLGFALSTEARLKGLGVLLIQQALELSGGSPHLSRRLADSLAQEQPLEALEILRRHLDPMALNDADRQRLRDLLKRLPAAEQEAAKQRLERAGFTQF